MEKIPTETLQELKNQFKPNFYMWDGKKMNKEEGAGILKDLQALQSEIELIRVHCIELQKRVMFYSDMELDLI